jgi:hypothetical protein
MDLSLIINSENLTVISEIIQRISIERIHPETLQECKQSALDLIRTLPGDLKGRVCISFVGVFNELDNYITRPTLYAAINTVIHHNNTIIDIPVSPTVKATGIHYYYNLIGCD